MSNIGRESLFHSNHNNRDTNQTFLLTDKSNQYNNSLIAIGNIITAIILPYSPNYQNTKLVPGITDYVHP